MNDALDYFGAVSLAVKDTDVFSADHLDKGSIDTNYRKNFHNNAGTDMFIVFEPQADFESIDGFIPFFQDSANDADFTKIVIGAEVTAPVKGQKIRLPFPAKHRRYIDVGATPKSTGVFTAKTVNVYIEFGPETE